MKLEIKIIETKPENELSIREVMPNAQIGQKMGQIFGELMALFGRNKAMITSPPFGMYHSFDKERLTWRSVSPLPSLKRDRTG